MLRLVDPVGRDYRDHGQLQRQDQRHVIGPHQLNRFLAHILDLRSDLLFFAL